MYTDKIREAFERIGFTGETTITQAKFNDILSKLMVALSLMQSTRSNEPYDKDVADELWEQASNGRSSIQINQVCETIDDGINILQSKLEEINSTSTAMQMKSGIFREPNYQQIIQAQPAKWKKFRTISRTWSRTELSSSRICGWSHYPSAST